MKSQLNFWTLSALNIGNMIGAGIFLIPSALAAIGSISLWSWLITTLGMLFLALVFLDLNKKYPHSGGPFIYAREAFGDFMGFAVAYTYWVAWAVGNTAMAVALVGYLGQYISLIYDGSSSYNRWMALLVKAGVIWLVTLVNILGVKESGRFQLVTTIIKIIPLAIISIAALFFIDFQYLKESFNITHESNGSAILKGLAITLWAYVGFESAVIPSEYAKNTSVIKKATLFGLLVTAFLYIVGSFALMAMFPASVLVHSDAPYANAAIIIFGNIGGDLVSIGAIIAILGALNGSIFIQVHVAMVAARHRLFLPLFSELSRFGTPLKGFVLSSLVMTLLLILTINDTLMEQFNFIVILSSFSFLISYLISAFAHFSLLIQEKRKGRILHFRWIVSILGGLYIFWTIIGAGQEVVFYGVFLFFSSFPLYALMKNKPRSH